MVDWQTLEAASLFSGAIASVSSEGQGFAAQLRSAKGDLDIDPVPRSSPSCRARLCGPGCGLNPVAHTIRSAVSAVDFAANSIAVPGIAAADYAHGEVRWLDGPQTGIVMSIVQADDAGLVLDRALDPAIAPGLRLTLREGCDRTIATCAARFDNAVNFQGEPFLPGNDLLAQYPVRR